MGLRSKEDYLKDGIIPHFYDTVDDEAVYLATMINPVNHRPYAAVWSPHHAQTRRSNIFWHRLLIVNPTTKQDLDVVGLGMVGEAAEESSRDTGCVRSHAPHGAAVEGIGLGLMIYSGLALLAAYASTLKPAKASELRLPHGLRPCIASPVAGVDRTYKASQWWEDQVKRGFAEVQVIGDESEEIEPTQVCDETEYRVPPAFRDELASTPDFAYNLIYEMLADTYGRVISLNILSVTRTGRIKYRFCAEPQLGPAKYNKLCALKVLESKFVIDVSPNLVRAGFKLRNHPEKLALALEADLRAVDDPRWVKEYLTWLASLGATQEQANEFYEGLVPADLKAMANPPPVTEHGETWRRVFEPFLDSF